MRKYSPKRKYSTTPNKKTNSKRKYGTLKSKNVSVVTEKTSLHTVYSNIINFIGNFFTKFKK